MNVFGTEMWANGDLNPANFALNTNLKQANQTNNSPANQTVTDTLLGAPLATGSPSYPLVNLGKTYKEVPHTTKGIALASTLLAAFGIQQVTRNRIPAWITYTVGAVSSMHVAKALDEGR